MVHPSSASTAAAATLSADKTGPERDLAERLLPVLMQIQTSLDDDLSLSSLADAVGLSVPHLHRLFRQLTQETPQKYWQRLRLERAALRLLMGRERILDVALECGYRSHETFSRAFRRRFGTSPAMYRSGKKQSPSPNSSSARPRGLEDSAAAFEISPTQVQTLGEVPVAFIRHVGPYESVDPRAWDRLLRWAEARGWGEPRLLLGIPQDAPGITEPDKLRFDAALRVPEAFEPDGDVGFQTLPGGLFGITTHVGPYTTLELAYRTAFERLSALRRYRIVGVPCIEIYHATRINPAYELNQTDLCIPLALA